MPRSAPECLCSLLACLDQELFKPFKPRLAHRADYRTVHKEMHKKGAKLLMYQAGADCHINDPLGGRFTDEQLRQRDRTVFELCKELGLPVAWNLAGGYQKGTDGSIEKVLRIHRATMDECFKVYGE